jgi:hypothetical protein
MLGISAPVAVFLQHNGEATVLVLNAIRGLVMEPVTVLIFSWNRPIFLWACLDSLYRYTRRPARFILIDNASDDPGVAAVIAGFARRGMFYCSERAEANLSRTAYLAMHRYRHLYGEYFVYIESDAVVFNTYPCWLSRLCALMDEHPRLMVLGSYIDPADFVDPVVARKVAPELDDARLAFLIKAHSPERRLSPVPPVAPLIDPFNPPGRLLMMRTRLLDLPGIDGGDDAEIYQKVKEAGFEAAIATGVRHRHLSLLNFFDYPDYPGG